MIGTRVAKTRASFCSNSIGRSCNRNNNEFRHFQGSHLKQQDRWCFFTTLPSYFTSKPSSTMSTTNTKAVDLKISKTTRIKPNHGRNRKILINKQLWEKVFNNNNYNHFNADAGAGVSTDIDAHNSNTLKEDNNNDNLYQLSPRPSIFYRDIELLLHEGNELMQSKTWWKKEEASKAFNLLQELIHTFHDEMDNNYTNNQVNDQPTTNNDTTFNNNGNKRNSYPWSKHSTLLERPNYMTNQQQQYDILYTSIEIIHRLYLSSLYVSHQHETSLLLKYIPIVAQEWYNVSQKNKQWTSLRNQTKQKNINSAAEILQYLIKMYMTLLLDARDLHSTLEGLGQVEDETREEMIYDENKKMEKIMDFSLSMYNSDLTHNDYFHQKYEEVKMKFRNLDDEPERTKVTNLYEMLIKIWCESAANITPTSVSSAPKSAFISAEMASYVLNEMTEELNLSPSISMYRKVIYTWSYLIQHFLQWSKKSNESFERNDNNLGNYQHHNNNAQQQQPSPAFNAAKCAHDVLNQVKKHHIKKQLNSNDIHVDEDRLDVGMYNAVLSSWANVTSDIILANNKRKSDNDFYLNQAAQIAQNLLDVMEEEAHHHQQRQRQRQPSENYQLLPVVPNSTSYKAVITAWSNLQSAENVDLLLKRMENKENLQPNIMCYGKAMKAYIKSKSIADDDLLERLEEILSRAESNAIQTLSKINDLSISNSSEISVDVKPNASFYGSIIYAWARHKCKTENDAMNAAEKAEAILDRMKRLHSESVIKDLPNVNCYGGVIAAWAKSKSIGHERSLTIFKDSLLPYLRKNSPKGNLEKESATIAFNTIIGLWGKQGEGSHANQNIPEIVSLYHSRF